jgi:hypothetical protein
MLLSTLERDRKLQADARLALDEDLWPEVRVTHGAAPAALAIRLTAARAPKTAA